MNLSGASNTVSDTEKYAMMKLESQKLADSLVKRGERGKTAYHMDLKTEGWTTDDTFPKDEDDYVRFGFF